MRLTAPMQAAAALVPPWVVVAALVLAAVAAAALVVGAQRASRTVRRRATVTGCLLLVGTATLAGGPLAGLAALAGHVTFVLVVSAYRPGARAPAWR